MDAELDYVATLGGGAGRLMNVVRPVCSERIESYDVYTRSSVVVMLLQTEMKRYTEP